MRGPLRRCLVVLMALASLAGCAHRLHVRPAYDTHSRRSLYRSGLAERRGAGLVSTNLSMWLQRGDKRFPGASGDLALTWPNWVRLRVDSSFGTLLDLGLQGDSVTAYVPSWRTGMRLATAGDSLQVDRPGDLTYCAFAAAWDPPDDAWEQGAVWTDSLLEIHWMEAGDSLVLGVRGDGLPAWIRVDRAAFDARISYRAWDRSAGVGWPTWLILDSGSGQLHLTVRTSQLRFAPRIDPGRLRVRMPNNAARLTVGDLRDLLGRLGAEK